MWWGRRYGSTDMPHDLILTLTLVIFSTWPFNLRPAGGGLLRPLSVFSRLSKKTAARSATVFFLAHLIIHLFRTCCENFRPRSRKVRSPDHVKWPHLIQSLNVRQSYTDWPIALKLSAIDTSNSVDKMFTSELRYRWPKVRSILWPLHYKSMGENWKRLFWTKPILNTLKHRVTGRLNTLSRPECCDQWQWPPRHVAMVISGHERSLAVFRQ